MKTSTSRPTISIIIATFNSEKLLPKVLKSIASQSFSQKIETLIIDGGSTDQTKAIALQHRCRVIDNPRIEPVYAKFLGFKEAKGHYVLYLDHDEVIAHSKSLAEKYSLMNSLPGVHAVIGSGYQSPRGYSFINEYINEFGDPFSFFIYRLSKDTRFFFEEMQRRYDQVLATPQGSVIQFHSQDQMPIIELCAVGSLIDRDFMVEQFPETLEKPQLIPHFFYLLQKKTALLGMTNNDPLTHYSSDTLRKYIKKIAWRVKNNIYHRNEMGESGFSGREAFSSPYQRLKKYLFLPYAFTILPVLFDSIWLMATRRKWEYWLHVPLTLFTAGLIVWHSLLKSLGARPDLKNYDDTRKVNIK